MTTIQVFRNARQGFGRMTRKVIQVVTGLLLEDGLDKRRGRHCRDSNNALAVIFVAVPDTLNHYSVLSVLF